MLSAIKAHLRDFLAILALTVTALLITGYIVQEQRLRIPVLEERPFELKAELETAQAVTPGQGQTVRVAGVRVGDIAEVEVDDGVAVVTMDIDQKFLPIYKDATILLRPKTGLKDMFLELDPGTQAAGEFEEGDTISVANTAPDVNLDEVLALLDTDTRAYLGLLLTGGAQGLEGRGEDLGKLLNSLGPLNRDLARLNTEVAKRKQNLANLIHNMNIFFGRVGQGGRGDRRRHRQLKLRLERDRLRGSRRPPRDQPAGPDAAGDPPGARRDERAGDRAGPDPQQPAAVRAQGRRHQQHPRSNGPRDDAATSKQHPAFREGRPQAGQGPEARGRPPGGRHAPAHDRRQQAQQALQHGGLQPERR